jgi:DUF2933 family protein
MSLHDHAAHHGQQQGGFLTWKVTLVLIGFSIIAGALLFTEHRAHVLGALIYLPLIICPLMHLFMHGGHGGHGSHGSDGNSGQDNREGKGS